MGTHHPTMGQFRHPLCNCCDDCSVCCLTTNAPCVTFGKVAHFANFKNKSCKYWGCFFALLVTFAIFFSILGETLLQNAEYVDEDSATVMVIIGVICVIIGLVISIYLCFVGCQLRGEVRKQKSIDGGACEDFCSMCCCNCCSLIQMSKEYGMVVDRPGGDDFEVEIRIQQSQPVSSNSIAMQSANSGVANSGFDGIEARAPPVYPVLSQ